MSNLQRNSRPVLTPFRPPFCPNPVCHFHFPHTTWHYIRDGFYTRPSDQRRFQRFRCLECNRRFSTRTFSPSYWLRFPRLLAPIAQLSANGAGIRQIARCLGSTHTTVARHLARLGRHCLLFHARLLERLQIEEPLVVDGFETFEFSQFFPCHMNLATGQKSWFLYGFTDSPLRRKGRMTEEQKLRRGQLESELGRPDPKAVEVGMTHLVRLLLDRGSASGTVIFHSDEHPAYPRAIRRVLRERREKRQAVVRVEHHQTPSEAARTHANPLFSVNLADLLLRHSNANHRRETIAFSKRLQASLERLAVFTVWRNLIKRRRENGGRETAGMMLGLEDRVLEWKDVLRRRLFPHQGWLPEPWPSYYWRRVKTRALGGKQKSHDLRYAF